MGNPPFGRDRPPRVAGAGGGEVSVVVRGRKSTWPADLVVVRRRVGVEGAGHYKRGNADRERESGVFNHVRAVQDLSPTPSPAVLVRCSRYPLPALVGYVRR